MLKFIACIIALLVAAVGVTIMVDIATALGISLWIIYPVCFALGIFTGNFLADKVMKYHP